MKSKLFYGLIASLALTACSTDELVSVNENGNEISYGIGAENPSRALDSYCNSVLPGSFKVWASTSAAGNLYIDGDLIVKAGSGSTSYTDATAKRFWPTESLDFFGEVNGDANFDFNGGQPKFNDFTVADAVNQQVDLLYGVKRGVSHEVVQMNFRHALSQIVFRARNTNPKLHVEISGVAVGHIGNQATFTFPATGNTDPNYENHTDAGVDATLPGAGTWTDAQASTLKQYEARFAPVTVGSELTSLTLPGADHVNGFENAMMLIPQTVAAWDPSVKGASYNGAYFLVKVKLANIAGSAYNAATDATLYDGYAAIPVQIDWKQGVRYIYTFVFGDGNGGYLPNPDDPQPVLTAIRYDLTTDDFVPVEKDPTNMNGDETETPVVKNKITLEIPALGFSQTIETEQSSAEFQLPDTKPVRDGYNFLGWSTKDNASVAEYQPGGMITVSKDESPLTLYPVWERQSTDYTLKFDVNISDEFDHTAAPADMTGKSNTGEYTFTIPSSYPLAEGIYCHGWASTPDATDVEYMKGDKITLKEDAPVKTLYAVWKSGVPSGGSGDLEGEEP